MDRPFDPSLGRYFDLLVGMHAHGSNAMVIDAAATFGCGFVLFPCCVIDEPFYPVIGVDWLECVADYAVYKGHAVYPFCINFKGQNIGLVAPGRCELAELRPNKCTSVLTRLIRPKSRHDHPGLHLLRRHRRCSNDIVAIFIGKIAGAISRPQRILQTNGEIGIVAHRLRNIQANGQ